MTSSQTVDTPDFVESVVNGLAACHDASETLQTFARNLLAEFDEKELLASTNLDIVRITAEAFDFFRERQTTDPKIRIRACHRDPKSGTNFPFLHAIEIINDDMPFLVDSTIEELNARNITILEVLHPIYRSKRNDVGALEWLAAATSSYPDGGADESFIQIFVAEIPEQAASELVGSLSVILRDVRLSVADWHPMLERLNQEIGEYEDQMHSKMNAEQSEATHLLKWLANGHMTLLGMRDYNIVGKGNTARPKSVGTSGLGILRDPTVRVLRRGRRLVHMTPEVRKFYFSSEFLIVTKSNVVSRVHRRVHMDYVGVKKFDRAGKIVGELRIVGLFASSAYVRSPRSIPLLRDKVSAVLSASGYPAESHSGKALLNVIETFPRDELFQISVNQLKDWTRQIVELQLKPRMRVLSRIDEFDRFVSILAFVPRDRYAKVVRERIGEYLENTYAGRIVAAYPFFPEGPLVRIHYIVARDKGVTPVLSQRQLETEIVKLTRTWRDNLLDELRQRDSGTRQLMLCERYGDAFSAGYAEIFSPTRTLDHIDHIEALTKTAPVSIAFDRSATTAAAGVRVSLFRVGEPIALSERVPILENMGFRVVDERSFIICPRSDDWRDDVCLHDMRLESQTNRAFDLARHKDLLCDMFLAVWNGDAENDAYNRLVLAADFDWRMVAVARTYGAYSRQISLPFEQRYLSDTLVRHAAITRDLFEIFRLRFDPDLTLNLRKRSTRIVKHTQRIEEALASVASLDEDRILRHFLNLILVTTRTNFYQLGKAGARPETTTLKFDSAKIDAAPLPRPFAEIFVHAPRIEGVHLRFAPIARGGLRWSDRPQDFRCEILGLVKAQQVKNAVIVPAGAKGGFVPKLLSKHSEPQARLEEGAEAYKVFINSLLSITDNVNDNNMIPPERVVSWDCEDPYLVVAADKGTAAFSDLANSIAVKRRYWLGDAFASGGSAGYDHKKMGITARGAWEAVKRHFRELDLDVQTTPITMIGVGDMSGDVFGNGMLLSKAIKLIAAFDHRDIFIDPDPDPVRSWEERQRLFALNRSSWQDYKRECIAEGGGVFPRSTKSISLTREIRELTSLPDDDVTPTALISALLKSPVDLLWFAGVGTFVRASWETNEFVADRANDAIRVSVRDVRAKVIAEGGNLGITQAGRVEFAMAGGRVNSDAIDNSAGVNVSDQEVNIKIALGEAVSSSRLTGPARDALLTEMTDAVATACLANNYSQTLALSLGERRGLSDLGFQQRLMHRLEVNGQLDRELECLPSDGYIAERRISNSPLTRPELSVLLAYAKITLAQEIKDSRIPDDPFLERVLANYFPAQLREQHEEAIRQHPLRREIISTSLANTLINRGGSTLVVRLQEETNKATTDIVYAFYIAHAVFRVGSLWRRVDALDNKIASTHQLGLYQILQDLLRTQTAWFLRHLDLNGGLTAVIDEYRSAIDELASKCHQMLTPKQCTLTNALAETYAETGTPRDLATDLAGLEFLHDAPNTALIARASNQTLGNVGRSYTQAREFFRISELRAAASEISAGDHFDRVAVNVMLNSITESLCRIVRSIRDGKAGSIAEFDVWLAKNSNAANRTRNAIDEIFDGTPLTLARLTVVASLLSDHCE